MTAADQHSPKVITCTRCRVPVEADKVHLPNRCNDPDCPLNEPKSEGTEK